MRRKLLKYHGDMALRGVEAWTWCSMSIHVSQWLCRYARWENAEGADVRCVGRSVWVGEALEIAYVVENGLYA